MKLDMSARERGTWSLDFPVATIRTSVPVDLTWRLPKVVRATISSFHGLYDGKEHVAVEIEGAETAEPPVVRVHSECLTGDVFGSGRCDCGEQLGEAIAVMKQIGGIILYLRQEGRGIGLYNKLDSYVLQDNGRDTYEANRELHFPDDLRDYRVAAQMLQAMEVNSIRLLSNNPDKRADLERMGIRIVEQCPTGVFRTEKNLQYLEAKVRQSGHTIKLG